MAKTSAKVKNAYAKRNYDNIYLQVKKGMKEQIRNHAQKKGYSLQGYINFLIQKDMQADGVKLDDTNTQTEQETDKSTSYFSFQ